MQQIACKTIVNRSLLRSKYYFAHDLNETKDDYFVQQGFRNLYNLVAKI